MPTILAPRATASYAEVFYFTRYLHEPRMWHPDGCLYELFTPGSMVRYRGYLAVVIRCLLNGWVTIKYETDHPYGDAFGRNTYEDIHVQTALGRLELHEADSEWQVLWDTPSEESESNEDYPRGPAAEWDIGEHLCSA